ncbi:inositol-pentakisphosphate 2-kinase-like [Uranotaenia lowii]|uniref:inositol-pentakisphosphate 2-kinase-like n=1 Tax=Uranotaenia lowii TaxID=190385 RepID=UPI00247B22AE|nr:inositol-pentakisphosphate 2-kinase-like [Uranotaenia lowii]
MRIFFSQRFVPEPKLARLDTYDLEEFNRQLVKFRPASRLKKEIKQHEGILYPDVAFLPAELNQEGRMQYPSSLQYYEQHDRTHTFPTYCVEIKPKQGWSFSEQCFEDNFIQLESLLPADFGTAPGKCRFCLYQYLKLRKKSIPKVSKYCPLDLFSGKPIRMLHAIKGLIGAPQNNFRLSKNGRIVYDESREKSVFNRILKEIFQRDGRSKEERKTIFMNLIKEILLKDFSTQSEPDDRKLLAIRKNRKKKDKNLIHNRTCTPINDCFLPKNCVLKQILDVQLFVKSSLADSNKCRNQQDMCFPIQAESLSYVDELHEKYLDYIDQIRCSSMEDDDDDDDGRSCMNSNPGEEAGRCSSNFTDFYLSSGEKYQLGATAMDCSIMLTFRRLSEREEERLPASARSHIVSLESMRFLVNVTITDLDAKSPNHHKKYVDQLRDSVGAYRDFMIRLRR